MVVCSLAKIPGAARELNGPNGALDTMMPTIDQALQGVKHTSLSALEGQLLMLHALGRSTDQRAWLLAHGDHQLSDQERANFERNVQHRLNHMPLSYLTGYKEFYGLKLSIDPRVLDPRADTETLVDWALECLEVPRPHPKGQDTDVLDMGTGSGAIALALKANRSECSIWALDKSPKALELAMKNARDLALDVHFLQGHWFDAFKHAQHVDLFKKFDLIVSNPPYIAPNDPHLANLLHEPQDALVAQNEGLKDLLEIASQSVSHLKEGAWLLLEHGHDQASCVRDILTGLGFGNIQTRQDLAGIDRCTGAQWLKMK
jgi:release factor glutamine methyltransferase